jgi:hypothetical protein
LAQNTSSNRALDDITYLGTLLTLLTTYYYYDSEMYELRVGWTYSWNGKDEN